MGANEAGRYVHARGTANGKRVQCNMAAKNHCVVMPDCDKEAALSQIIGAAFGAAGLFFFFFLSCVFFVMFIHLRSEVYGFECGHFCGRDERLGQRLH